MVKGARKGERKKKEEKGNPRRKTKERNRRRRRREKESETGKVEPDEGLGQNGKVLPGTGTWAK